MTSTVTALLKPLTPMKIVVACLLTLAAAFPVVAQNPSPTPAPATEVMGSTILPWADLAPNAPTRTGARRMVFERPTATLSKFHCHVSQLNPGENTGPLHRHPQEELIVLKEGTLEVNLDGRKQTAEAGAMIFYSANANESMTNPGRVPAVYCVFQFYTDQTPKSE